MPIPVCHYAHFSRSLQLERNTLMKNLQQKLSPFLLTVAMICSASLSRSEEGSPSQEASGKTTAQILMQDKVRMANELFSGMIGRDLGKVLKSAEALKLISKATSWHRPNDAEFNFYARSFQNSTESLIENAQAKNYEGVGMSYFRLTLACMNCHNTTRFAEPKVHQSKTKK